MIKSQRYGTGQRRTTLVSGQVPIEYQIAFRMELQAEERRLKREQQQADKAARLAPRRWSDYT